MDFASAVLYLYLLFTPLPSWPPYFEGAVNPSVEDESIIYYRKRELQKFLSQARQNDAEKFFTDEELAELGEEESFVRFAYSSRDSHLKALEEGNERFYVSDHEDGSHSLLIVNEDAFVCITYDQSFTVREKAEWANGKSLETAVMKKKTVYDYDGSLLVHIREELLEKGSTTDTFYNEAELPVRMTVYVKKDDEEALSSETDRVYDEENRLVQEEVTDYVEVADPLRRGEKKTVEDKKKYIYKYTDRAESPDTEYYENGVLKISDSYLDPDTHEQVLYFENNYSIKTLYKHGRKVLEKVFINGRESRSREFE